VPDYQIHCSSWHCLAVTKGGRRRLNLPALIPIRHSEFACFIVFSSSIFTVESRISLLHGWPTSRRTPRSRLWNVFLSQCFQLHSIESNGHEIKRDSTTLQADGLRKTVTPQHTSSYRQRLAFSLHLTNEVYVINHLNSAVSYFDISSRNTMLQFPS
jgi:hypothetical protein